MSDSVQPMANDGLEDQRESRRLLRQYTVLTVSNFLPLILSFVGRKNPHERIVQ